MSEKKTNKRGPKPKAEEDLSIPVTFMTKVKVVKSYGGMEAIRKHAAKRYSKKKYERDSNS